MRGHIKLAHIFKDAYGRKKTYHYHQLKKNTDLTTLTELQD